MQNITEFIEKLKFESKQCLSIRSFIESVPKVELHVHLNGCIREETLIDLAKERNVQLSHLLHEIHDLQHETPYVNNKKRSLLECFEIFGEIATCVTDLPALRRITREALEDFSKSGVAYVELRSTPKVLTFDDRLSDGRKATKRMYVDTIIEEMINFENREKNRVDQDRIVLTPRLILSINRSESIENAMENANLAVLYKMEGNKYVVGLELSGNPQRNLFRNFEPALKFARDNGLYTSVHCGEIPCEEEDSSNIIYEDTIRILEFSPDRLGHALLLTESMYRNLESRHIKIPIECCPTSNVMTLELAKHVEGDLTHGLRRHPRLSQWISTEYPISISTDDPGIFNTDPITELMLLAEAFQMSEPWHLIRIILDSISHSFESNEFKSMLCERFQRKIKSILQTDNSK